jgi:hypothetical protein
MALAVVVAARLVLRPDRLGKVALAAAAGRVSKGCFCAATSHRASRSLWALAGRPRLAALMRAARAALSAAIVRLVRISLRMAAAKGQTGRQRLSITAGEQVPDRGARVVLVQAADCRRLER